VFQPSFSVNSPTSSCLGGTINLTASGANSYTWNGTTPFPTIPVSPSTPTFYLVQATSTLNGVSCISTNTVFVTIYANPTITAAPHRTIICVHETTSLTASGGVTYTWTSQNAIPMAGNGVPVSPVLQTNYTVTGTDQNGCKSTATVQVKVSSCAGILENGAGLQLSIYPNPNNGEFVVQSPEDIELSLVNELGQLITRISLNEGNHHQVSLQGIAGGIYFVTGGNGKANVNQKVVITK
jgi:hypothetical protein